MKLIKRTYIYTSVWVVPFVILGTLFSFFMIEYIAYEETEEFLTYEMERLVEYHQEHNDLPGFSNVAAILEDVGYEAPFFKDTLLLETGDNEMVPYRELWFSIEHNGRDFTIILRHLLPGRDDILEGTLLIVSGLMLLIALFLFLTVNLVTGKIWSPFYSTLGKLTRFKISDPVPAFEASKIDEFNSLNTTLQNLLTKISDDYRYNKEFNENASHELQTHLAEIKASAARLITRQDEQEENSGEAGKIYSAATRLSQLQKSLLLLSRISNREFSNNVHVKLDQVVNSSLETYSEAMGLRGIRLTSAVISCGVHMDAGLAGILVNNVVKNAVKHNLDNGYIRLQLIPTRLQVTNSGQPFDGEPSSLLQRFSKGAGGNAGIGLAVVKEICDLYRFTLDYTITDNTHTVTIDFGAV